MHHCIFLLLSLPQTRIRIFLWRNKSGCRQEKECGHNTIVLCRTFCPFLRLSLLVRRWSWWRWWRRRLWRRWICSSLIWSNVIQLFDFNFNFSRTYAYLLSVSEYLNFFHLLVPLNVVLYAVLRPCILYMLSTYSYFMIWYITHIHAISPHTQPPPSHTHAHTLASKVTDSFVDIQTDTITHPPKTCLYAGACLRVRAWYNPSHDAVLPLRLMSAILWFPPLLSLFFLHLVSAVNTALLFFDLQRYVYSILLTHVQYSTLAVRSRTLPHFNATRPHTNCTA